MNKKVLISLLLIGVLAFGAGLATMAWFTDSSTSAENVFVTGTLEIEGPGDGEIAEGLFEIEEGIFPSWNESKPVAIFNKGTLPFQYRVTAIATADNLLSNGEHGLHLKISRGDDELYNDGINKVNDIELGNINAGDQDNLTFTFSLPNAADNAYQGLNNSFKFIFEARQVQDGADWPEREPANGDEDTDEDIVAAALAALTNNSVTVNNPTSRDNVTLSAPTAIDDVTFRFSGSGGYLSISSNGNLASINRGNQDRTTWIEVEASFGSAKRTVRYDVSIPKNAGSNTGAVTVSKQ